MPDVQQRRVLDLPWRTLFKLLAAAALIWVFLRLSQVILLILVSAILAVALEPLVRWLQQRRLSRTAAVLIVCLSLIALVAGFFVVTWNSLAQQAQTIGAQLAALHDGLAASLPSWLGVFDVQDGTSALQSYALRIARSAASATTYIVLGFVVTIYLLLDGARTYRWLLAFVPARLRPRADQTAIECREVITGYFVGNVITSAIAAACTYVALVLLDVPAALLLALLAGLSDFVPVLGFIASAIPAVLLAMTVSTTTAVIVVLFYIAYNTVENYLISPWAYGNRMRMSDLAIILAFAAGAELAGVIGALIALPIAAMYPPIERIWLRGKLPDETVQEHRLLDGRQAG
jgi:predicted PurR-regulated permease PerM